MRRIQKRALATIFAATTSVTSPFSVQAQDVPAQEPDILWDVKACFYLRNNYTGGSWSTCRIDPSSGRYVGHSITVSNSYMGDDVRYGEGDYTVTASGNTANITTNVHNNLTNAGIMVSISNGVEIEVKAWARPKKFESSENSERKDVNLKSFAELLPTTSDVHGSAREGRFAAVVTIENPSPVLVDSEQKTSTQNISKSCGSVPHLEKLGYPGEWCLVGSGIISPTANVHDNSTLFKGAVDATANVKYSFSVNPSLLNACAPSDFKKIAQDKLAGLGQDFERNPVITKAYADMYLSDPAMKWAGMAAFASAAVGKGLRRVELARDAGFDLISGLTGVNFTRLREQLGNGNLLVYSDIYWQHLAFQCGGIDELKNLSATHKIDPYVLEAWRKIDQGKRESNQDLIWEGNRDLLWYEQSIMLQPNIYDPDRGMWKALTTPPSSWIEFIESPIPNDPNNFNNYIPGGDFGSITDRWKWIDESMLPAWKKLETSNPSIAKEEIQNITK